MNDRLPLALRVLRRLLDEAGDCCNTRHGDISDNERNALEVLIAHAEEGQ